MGAIGFGPGFAVRRGDGLAGFDFTGAVMPVGASLTRASAGTRTDAGGAVASEAMDVARFDHDPVTLALAGLLVEAARSNLVTYSDQIDNAAWTKASVGVSANDRAAPDGSGAADRLTFGGGGVLQRSAIGNAGAALSVSIWLYASAAVPTFQFGLYDNVVGAQYQTLGLGAGVWTRFAVTRSFGAGATDRRMALIAPAGGMTVWGWGGQAEAAASVSSYVATGAAAGSRAADVLTLTLPGSPDGAAAVRATFDDLSVQDVTLNVVGGSAVVPALNRARLRRIERV